MKRVFFLFILILQTATALASGEWEQLANGDHSLKTLGPGFFVEVPVRKISKHRIKLAFVNRPLVERLGLELPVDPDQAEQMLTDLFGYEVDPRGTSTKTWMASHYLDGKIKGPGHAMGDGRALWTGELKLETKDGKILYIDGVQKGVGVTPFAWLKNPTHNDGRQNTGELVKSAIVSIADASNELDSTGDIIGFTVDHEDGQKTSMTLRVGRQTRPAHIAFHADSPANEKKMMDYIVVRDLGLPIGTIVTRSMFLKWQENFATNNAEDTARVYALNGFFEHPTKGNKTTTGGSIDLNGRQYMDAYHVNLTHLFHRYKVDDQLKIQKHYIRLVNGFLVKARYFWALTVPFLTARMEKLFDRTFIQTASQLQLHRLGLSDADIALIPEQLRLEFFHSVDKLMRATGEKPTNLFLHNANTIPAAFDMRKVLSGTLAALNSGNLSQQREALDQLFTVESKWSSGVPIKHVEDQVRYVDLARTLVATLGGKIKPEWLQAAKQRTTLKRFDATGDGFWVKHADPIREKVETGKLNWVEISDLIDQAAEDFIDRDQPHRSEGMLKPAARAYKPRLCQDLFSAKAS